MNLMLTATCNDADDFKINENFSKKNRMKNILIGIFILTLLSLWYAMIDLSKTPSPYSIP